MRTGGPEDMSKRFLKQAAALIACALPLAAAHAGDAAPRCLYVDVADVPVHYLGANMMPAVEGVINGKPATMLVDTGASETSVTLNGAVRHDLGMFMTGRYVQGVAGDARLYTTRVKEIGIGPAKSSHSVELPVIGQDNFEFDAIAGAPFLLQADLEIDLRAKQMRFFRSRDCGDRPLLLWKEDTVVVPFEHHRDRSPNPHFTVRVNGQELDAFIDTGAHHTVMTLAAARKIGIDVDGPGAKRLGIMGGVGSERAAHWSIRLDTFQIGEETIKSAEIGIVDMQGDVPTDVLLGQDFLRAHRVLFAMSQKKLYFAYLGGDAFTRSTGVPAWVRAEAEGGSPDGQYALALAYANGDGVARDPALARTWLEKAAAGGQPHAQLWLGRQKLRAGQAADAIPLLRAGLEQLPANHVDPLWLYLARVRNGEAGLAQTELRASLDKHRESAWPDPVAEFYLGKLDAARLLDEAGKDKASAHARTCMADEYMAEWQSAQGRQEQAETLRATLRAQCAPATPAARPAAAANAAP
jgi:clan AA aspartic protease (TIGR02281 family)